MSRHLRTVVSGPFDVTNDAACLCRPATHVACPRHRPAAYAEMYASHAVDSLTPAQRYHSSNQFGR